MKRIVLILLLAAFCSALYSQEEIIGETTFDLQTNGSCQNRIYLFDDGFIGTTWTYGMQYVTYPDRGTGYNHKNEAIWQPLPNERIESQRSGWPSYAPLGTNGEIIISHMSGYGVDSGLVINKRALKGEGDWIESFFQGPLGYEKLLWPRMVTGGGNHTSLFLLALTAPTANGGAVYQGLDGALLYSRSTNIGVTWNIHNQILPGMDSIEYDGFSGDCYAFAEPIDSIVAFVVGSPKTDMFLMKSADYGQTFDKTIIWDNPYDTILPIDTFFCVDGSMSLALDMSGKAHVVFGIVSAYYNNDWGLNRYTDGVGYWNEDREPFSSNNNALNPEDGPGSEMIPDYNLIGWSQDLNGNGQLDFSDIGIHGSFGISSMVQILIDETNRIFLCYTSITEGYHFYGEHLRRLWFRSSFDNGVTWGQFYHYVPDDPYQDMFDFMFPSCAANSEENIHCNYFTGFEPGTYGHGGSETPENNEVWYTQISKDEIVDIKQNKLTNIGFEVSQNFPNPFTETTTINVNLRKPADIKLEVINLFGQKVYETNLQNAKPGLNTFSINAEGLVPGVYFYTVETEGSSVTNKMILE